MVWLLIGASVICGMLGAYVAGEKDRGPLEGAMFGCLLGPLGLLIAALMPAGPPAVERPAIADRVQRMDRPSVSDPSRSIRRIG